MPEGDSLRRLANQIEKMFSGSEVQVVTNDPRLQELSGQELIESDATGKNLFLKFPNTYLHIHLGLFGKASITRLSRKPAVTSPKTFQMFNEKYAATITSPMRVEAITGEEKAERVSKLGPDPLSRNPSGEEGQQFISNFQKSGKAVADALLDQSLVAGVGNIIRAEVLYNLQLNPFQKSKEIDEETLEKLWEEVDKALKEAVENKRITMSIYSRRGKKCPSCGNKVVKEKFRGRYLHYCPVCQTK